MSLEGSFGMIRQDRAALDPDRVDAMDARLGGGRRTRWVDSGVALGGALALRRDGGCVLVADGHVDDRRRLSAALGIDPSVAQDLEAAPLLLRAYERWGADCMQHLVGEFAFAVWQPARRALLLATSAPLARPCHLFADRSLFAWASRAAALFALPQLRRRADEERLAHMLTRTASPPDQTFFARVRQLPPGHLLRVDERGERSSRWWNPSLVAVDWSPEEAARHVCDELLPRIIEDQLPQDGTPGVTLSGGLDSQTVAALAASGLASSGRHLAAYTDVPPDGFGEPVVEGRYADESPHVAALAALYPNLRVELRSCDRGLLDGVTDTFEAAGIPFRNAANRGWIEDIYAHAGAQGVHTLLNGDQGNLTLSWSGGRLLPGLLASGHLRRAVREARAMARADARAASWSRALLASGLRPLLPPLVTAGMDVARGRGTPGRLRSPAALSLAAPAVAAQAATPRLSAWAHGHPRNRLLVIERTGATGAMIAAGNRLRFGVDTRTPLADRRLVEFCLTLPETAYAGGGRERLLVRNGMAGRLPESVMRARARGLQSATWFATATRDRERLLAAVGRFEEHDSARRLIDLPRLRGLLETWPRAAPTSWADVGLYRGQVGIALMAGAFLLWAETEPSRPPAYTRKRETA